MCLFVLFVCVFLYICVFVIDKALYSLFPLTLLRTPPPHTHTLKQHESQLNASVISALTCVLSVGDYLELPRSSVGGRGGRRGGEGGTVGFREPRDLGGVEREGKGRGGCMICFMT